MDVGTDRCPTLIQFTIHLKTNVITVAPIAPFSCGMCFEESWCDGADRTELEQNRISLRAFVRAVMYLQVPYNHRTYLPLNSNCSRSCTVKLVVSLLRDAR
jgi:hypothetical protein